jgi:SAM-dependent methyltransferase
MTATYSFDPAWTRERERLNVQSSLLDPGTIRHLEALGVSPGWRCAEIAAGTGSIARWLKERVGSAGHVVATDVDTRFLDQRVPRLDVRRHDIEEGPLLPGAFDIVHTRLLLMHLRHPERALANMVASARPGGWVLVEDYDLATAGLFHPPSELQVRVNEAVQILFERRGADPRYGRKLAAVLAAAGLQSVHAEGRLQVVPLGSPEVEALALKLEQFGPRLIDERLLSEEDLRRALEEARTSTPGAVHYPPLMIAAWGRRP